VLEMAFLGIRKYEGPLLFCYDTRAVAQLAEELEFLPMD